MESSESRQILTDNEQGQYGTSTPTAENAPAGFGRIGSTGGQWVSNVSGVLTNLGHAFSLPKSISSPARRHVLALMAFFGFCNVYAMRVNLTIAVISMRTNQTRDGHMRAAEFAYWSQVETGEILGAFFYGYCLTQIPGGWLAQRYGGRNVLGLGILGTGFLTFLTPPVAHMGKFFLIALRAAEGLCEGVTYPAMHAMWSHWAPPPEKTKLATFVFSGSYFGTVISLPLSAWLAQRFGWPSIFYLFGICALMWCMLWFKLIAETPSEDRSITQEEAVYIQDSIGFRYEEVKFDKPPWREIFLSKPVWAISIAHFCSNWGFYTMLTYLPKFMADVMHFSLTKSSIFTALPYLMMAVTLVFSGQIVDYLRTEKQWSTTFTRKSFGSYALLAQAVFTILSAHSPNVGAAVFFITLAIGCGGFAWAGFSVNHLDIAPQYASVLMGVSNTFATIPGMISPVVVGLIVNTGDPWEWRVIFYISAVIYVIGAVFYWLWASGDVQPWAQLQPTAAIDDSTGVGVPAAGPRSHDPME